VGKEQKSDEKWKKIKIPTRFFSRASERRTPTVSSWKPKMAEPRRKNTKISGGRCPREPSKKRRNPNANSQVAIARRRPRLLRLRQIHEPNSVSSAA
jgi:hypothetical protein